MALTKVGKEGITGVSNASNATFLTATSAEGVTLAGTLAVTGVHTVGTNAVATSEGGAVTTNVTQGLTKCFWRYLISNNTFADSLNVSGGTDNGTGLYTIAIANDFNSAAAMVGTSSGFTSNGGLRETGFVSYAVGSIQCTTAASNGGGIDIENSCCHINGDLA